LIRARAGPSDRWSVVNQLNFDDDSPFDTGCQLFVRRLAVALAPDTEPASRTDAPSIDELLDVRGDSFRVRVRCCDSFAAVALQSSVTGCPPFRLRHHGLCVVTIIRPSFSQYPTGVVYSFPVFFPVNVMSINESLTNE
jgi:hypothetical protein